MASRFADSCRSRDELFADWATSVIHGLAILGVYHQFTRILIARFHLCDVMPTVDHVTRSLSDALDTRAVQLRLGAFLREEVATAYRARHWHRRIHCKQARRKHTCVYMYMCVVTMHMLLCTCVFMQLY